MKVLETLKYVNENVVMETIAEYTEEATLIDSRNMIMCSAAWYDNDIFINVIEVESGLFNVIVKKVNVFIQ